MPTISSTEAARHLGDYLARVKHRGETFVLTKNDRPVAELRPVTPPRVGTWGDLVAAMKAHPVDSGFFDDLERINRADQIATNPWD